MGSLWTSRVFIICIPPPAATKCNHRIKLSLGPRKHCIVKKLKNDSVQPQGHSSPSTKLADCSENTNKVQKARRRLMAVVRQPFPLWHEHLRPHDLLLASGNINAVPVSHPALVKTSDQPLFSSSNFSPFTSAVPLRSSDTSISPMPSLN
jgi:hypothetical protein